MEEGAGIYRDEPKMEKTCKTLRTLRERFKDIIIEDRGSTFNTEVMNALELDFMLDVAEAVANSALIRRESRGSHTRTDFPKRDDENFLKHTLAYRTTRRTKDRLPASHHHPMATGGEKVLEGLETQRSVLDSERRQWQNQPLH